MKTKIVNNKIVPFKVNAISAAMLLILFQNGVEANPNGATIINGQVSIDRSLENITSITNSPNAIINWQNFNISQNEITRFIQQNSQSAVLNRVIGQNPSQILGQLVSNGQVFLINPNGIVFGANSVIDTQGMIASTLNLSNQDFLTGNYHFVAGNNAGSILNQGIIRAGEDGNIILIAPDIKNSGIISTEGGQITLAAGSELTLTNLDSPEIQFQIQAPENKILNMGEILTQGGAINLFAGSITHSGDLNANSIEVDKQGNIKLVALQDVNLTNQNLITANHAIEKGGNIQISANTIAINDESKISATGQTGGGEILIGGDYQGKNPNINNATSITIEANTTINANAKLDKDGGRIIIWSDDTTIMHGTINATGGENSGDGGFVEVSGKQHLQINGLVDVTAKKGKTGKLLLDPGSITIQTGTNIAPNTSLDVFNTDWVEDQLDTANLVIKTSDSTNGVTENIDINAPVTWNSGNFLELIAGNDINLNSPITNTGIGDLILTAGKTTALGSSFIIADITLSGGALKINGNSLWIGDSTITGNIDNFGVIKSISNNTLNGVMTNTGIFDWESYSLTLATVDSEINNLGTFRVNSSSQMTGPGSFNNSSLVEKTVSATPDQFNVIFNNSNGKFDISGDNIALVNGGIHEGTLTINNGLLKMKGGIHILEDGLVITGIGNLETDVTGHTGKLTIGNNKTILTSGFQNNSPLIIKDTATLKANGTFDNSITGIISGKGRIEAATFNNNGTISPGTSPGILTILGDLNLGSTSVIEIEIEGNNATPPEFDQINVTGNIDLDGTLNVSLPTAYDPTADTFNIITSSGSINNNFAIKNTPLGYSMDVTKNSTPNNITLENFNFLGSLFWDNDSNDNFWNNPINWSTDTLPVSGDTVVINKDSLLVTLKDGNHTIGKLISQQDLLITDNAKLTIEIEFEQSQLTRIDNNGTLIMQGELEGTGQIDINPTGTLELQGDNVHNLNINNRGTLIKSGTGTAVLAGNIVNNDTHGIFNINEGNLTIEVPSSSSWVNNGIINMTDDTNLMLVPMGADLINNGTLSGSGKIEVATVINNNTIKPNSSSSNKLTFTDNLILNNSSVIDIQISGNSPSFPMEFDQLNVGGDVTLNGTLNVTLPTGFDPIFSSFPIITSAGSLGGTFTTVNSPNGYNMVTDITSPIVTLKNFSLLNDIFWDNDSGDGLWTTLVNWSTNALPKPTDSVIIDLEGSSPVRLNNGNHTIDKLRLNHDLFINNAQLTVKSNTEASKPIEIETGGTLLTQGRLLGTGKINIRTGGTLALSGAYNHALNIINDGILAQKGTGTAGLTGNVTNNTHGQFNINDALSIEQTTWTNTGIINLQTNNSILAITSPTSTLSTLTNEGTLKGFGFIKANKVINQGLISPGASLGTLTFSNDLILTPSSTIDIELAGISPSHYDQIKVTNTAVLDGSLNVNEIEGFTPTTDTSFSLITCGKNCFGNFNDTSLPSTEYTATVSDVSSGLKFTAPIVIDPDPIITPDPVVDPDPIVIPDPIIDPDPVVDPDPIVIPDPIIDPDPVVDPNPIIILDPIIDPDPIVKPDPIVIPDPIIDPDPIVKPDPIVIPDPIIDPDPIVKPDPIVIPDPIVKPDPVIIPNFRKRKISKRKPIIVPEDDVLPLINNGNLRLLNTKKINPKSYLLKQDNKLNKELNSEEEEEYPLEQCNAQ